jgi:hypothetical protein
MSPASKWLLIFDNVENADLLMEYWPIALQGRVLLTTRNHNFAYEPAEAGIEVPSFDSKTGTAFVLHLLSIDIAEDITIHDSESAQQLSDRLRGYTLAISQMAGLIHRGSYSISEFL